MCKVMLLQQLTGSSPKPKTTNWFGTGHGTWRSTFDLPQAHPVNDLPPDPGTSRSVGCKLHYIDFPGRVIITCNRCGHQAERPGTSQSSIEDTLKSLEKTCPFGELNQYQLED